MKVKDLIKELRKYPPDSLVGWRDHDASEDEISAHVNSVNEWTEDLQEATADRRWTKGIKVVIGA